MEQQAEQSLSDWTASHFDQLLMAIEPEAEKVAAELQRDGQALYQKAREYFTFSQRIDGWRGAASLHDGKLRRLRIVGIDVGSDLLNRAEYFTGPVPSPAEVR